MLLANRALVPGRDSFTGRAFAQMYGYVGPPLTAPPSTSKPEDRCVVQGHVTNSLTGEPLRKANVRLQKKSVAAPGGAEGTMQGYATISETDGSFKISNIEPGQYSLSGNRNGYLSTDYGAKDVKHGGTTLTLTARQQTTDLNLALIPQAVITGKVVDQDGDPVPNAMISLIAAGWQRGKLNYGMRNSANTNDLGEYRMPNVQPGRFYLMVQRGGFAVRNEPSVETGKPDIRPVRTFYPGAARLEDAAQLEAKAGQEMSGMDVRLITATTYHIRGRVVGAVPQGAADRMNVQVSARGQQDFAFLFSGAANVTKERTFDVAGLPPGSYTVNVFAIRGQVRAVGRQEVDVGQADVNDVQLTLTPPTSLRGQISVEGNPPAGANAANVKSVRLFVYTAEPGAMMFGSPQTTPDDDGTFTMEDLAPGRYFLNAGPMSGTYLKSVRYGSQEVFGRAIDVTQGGGQLTLVYSYGVAELDGTVQSSDSGSASTALPTSPKSDEMVVLVPETLNEDGTGMHFGSADSSASFKLKNLRPGRYRAYAFEQIDANQLDNPALRKELESRGVEVELNEKDQKQIQLPLITEEEMQKIYSQLGIDGSQD